MRLWRRLRARGFERLVVGVAAIVLLCGCYRWRSCSAVCLQPGGTCHHGHTLRQVREVAVPRQQHWMLWLRCRAQHCLAPAHRRCLPRSSRRSLCDPFTAALHTVNVHVGHHMMHISAATQRKRWAWLHASRYRYTAGALQAHTRRPVPVTWRLCAWEHAVMWRLVLLSWTRHRKKLHLQQHRRAAALQRRQANFR